MSATLTTMALSTRTRSFRSAPALLALAFLVVVGVISLIAPLLPLDPTSTDLAVRGQPPSPQHWFGTDELGRDYFSRVVYGGRISLTVGILAMAAATVIGVVVGVTAGYARGRIDDALMRFVDFLSSIPWMVLVIVASVFLKPGLWTIIIVIGLFSWMGTARLVRAETLSLRERTYVGYARYIGVRRERVVWRHILPEAAPTIIVAATASISVAILTESALSFLGLGIQPPMASWGSLLETAQGSLQSAPVPRRDSGPADPAERALVQRAGRRAAPVARRGRRIVSDGTTALEVVNLDVDLPARSGTGTIRVLDAVSFEVARGRVCGIVGESGSGKTMLLRSLLDILPRGAERSWDAVRFDGEDVTARFSRRRLPMAMVFQDPMTSFNPLMRIGAHLTEVARRYQRVSRREARDLAREALEAVRIPDPERVLDRFPHELSGGMRQRAMIAMALLARPQVLLADEPTTALDATIQAQILALIRSVQTARDLTVVFVTHDLGVVAAICDDVLVMKDGRIVETGSVHQVLGDPQHPYTRALIAAAPDRERSVGMTDAGEAADLIEVRSLVKTFALRNAWGRRQGEVRALDGVDLTIRRGETLALVGESGSGKTTLGRCILQMEEPTSGTVTYDGTDLTSLPRARRAPFHRSMQVIFQDPVLVAEPAPHGPSECGRAGRRADRRARPERARHRGARRRRHRGRCRPQAPAGVQRRPASAHRHRTGDRGASDLRRLRRAALGARHVDPGAGDRPADASSSASST